MRALNGQRDDGATAVEYAIMVAAIAAVVIAIVFAVGTQTCKSYEATSQNIKAAQPTGPAAGACP